MKLYFTQYLRPNGRKTRIVTEIPDEYEKRVNEIHMHGFAFEIEELRTGAISMTIADPMIEEDAAQRICANNEEVPINIRAMIDGFDMERALVHRANVIRGSE